MGKQITAAAVSAPRARRSQAERRAASDQSLLKAAAELTSNQGYGATTLEQIGLRAGYSRGLVTQRFQSKEGLVVALVELLHRDFAAATFENPAAHDTGRAAILGAIDYYMAHLSGNLVQLRAYFVLMSESIGVIPEIRSAFVSANRQFRDHLSQKLLDGQADGSIAADLEADKTANALMSLVTGHTLICLVDPAFTEPDHARQDMIAAAARLLSKA
jgi:AcrR family transcriptional regulator